MPRITDVRTTIWEWIGPVAPTPPHFCTSASDIVSDVTGSISAFRFLGWLVVELECSDGTIGIGNAAGKHGLAPHATKTVIDHYLKPLLIGADPLDSEYLWASMYRRTLPFGRKGIGMARNKRSRSRNLGRQGKDIKGTGIQASRWADKTEYSRLCEQALQPTAP